MILGQALPSYITGDTKSRSEMSGCRDSRCGKAPVEIRQSGLAIMFGGQPVGEFVQGLLIAPRQGLFINA